MQYKQLNELLEKYNDETNSKCGLKVLAVPCNQFGKQEPGENAYEILNGIKHVRPGYGFKLNGNIKMLEKSDVNGKEESKLFTFLKSRCPVPDNVIDDADKISWSPVRNNDITWNFEKILVDHKGQPFRRYTPTVEPKDITEDIENLRKKCNEDSPFSLDSW